VPSVALLPPSPTPRRIRVRSGSCESGLLRRRARAPAGRAAKAGGEGVRGGEAAAGRERAEREGEGGGRGRGEQEREKGDGRWVRA